jgi:hypothetical protein
MNTSAAPSTSNYARDTICRRDNITAQSGDRYPVCSDIVDPEI